MPLECFITLLGNYKITLIAMTGVATTTKLFLLSRDLGTFNFRQADVIPVLSLFLSLKRAICKLKLLLFF